MKHESRAEADTPLDTPFPPAPNLKADNWFSQLIVLWAAVVVVVLVVVVVVVVVVEEKHLVRQNGGRTRKDFLRLCKELEKKVLLLKGKTYSAMNVFVLSVRGSGVVSHGEIISSSIVSTATVTCSLTSRAIEYGALCGRGERSIGSDPNPGEDDGTGGVVQPSHRIGGVVAPSVSLISGCSLPDLVSQLLTSVNGQSKNSACKQRPAWRRKLRARQCVSQVIQFTVVRNASTFGLYGSFETGLRLNWPLEMSLEPEQI